MQPVVIRRPLVLGVDVLEGTSHLGRGRQPVDGEDAGRIYPDRSRGQCRVAGRVREGQEQGQDEKRAPGRLSHHNSQCIRLVNTSPGYIWPRTGMDRSSRKRFTKLRLRHCSYVTCRERVRSSRNTRSSRCATVSLYTTRLSSSFRANERRSRLVLPTVAHRLSTTMVLAWSMAARYS